ncbi:DUF285 domain-containing protein [Pseudoalteromonas sp. OFAV1]|uniref:DUF285 domain-containing protein n=1 Tax=Pseudoalteromonas sp. OFAV1 TaxID=2908892 RepID=UPI001F177690|nr:DUF285 domain-containing protein [Pseudoalteromonas sp. OFAV1]MCF2901158.1 DUF285 domain-containing protein [Pseudoalteromonas sp. OFAV1]
MKTKISLVTIIAATALSLSETTTAKNTMRFGATVGPDLALNASADGNGSDEIEQEPNVCTPEQRVVTRAELDVLIANNDPAISNVCTAQITDFIKLFENNKTFSQDISNWDTSNVSDMRYIFRNSSFNGDISRWDTKNVTRMDGMFENSMFIGDVSTWNTSNVTNMYSIFRNTEFKGGLYFYLFSQGRLTYALYRVTHRHHGYLYLNAV